VQSLFAYYNKENNTSYSTDFIEWIEGDILDTTSLDIAMKGITTVFHCAATVTFLKADFHTCIKVNRIGTANVVNACLTNNIEKLCYVSSTAAIGTSKVVITEETKWDSWPIG
jgi:nucleoside-diphosphate-sugar epimerase